MHTVGSLVVRLLQECEGDLAMPVMIDDKNWEVNRVSRGVASVTRQLETYEVRDSINLVTGEVREGTSWQKA